MKVLCDRFPSALHYIHEGLRRVFENIGWEWQYLNPNIAVLDSFNDFEPDLFIGKTYEITRPIAKAIAARPDMKVVMKANNWGKFCDEETPFPICNANEKEIQDTLHNQPDLVYNFYHENRLEYTMGHWEKNGINLMSMLPAADIMLYQPYNIKTNRLECDIAFCGGYWPYKAINLNRYIIPLCYPVGKYNIKIFGNQHWPIPQYLGSIDTKGEVELYNSALICPNISEPHANKYGFEVNERIFKLAACGAFVISDNIASLREDIFTNNELVIADDPDDFQDLIHNFTINPQMRDEFTPKLQKTVMEHHTYFNRVYDMLMKLGWEDSALKCFESHKQLLKIRKIGHE